MYIARQLSDTDIPHRTKVLEWLIRESEARKEKLIKAMEVCISIDSILEVLVDLIIDIELFGTYLIHNRLLDQFALSGFSCRHGPLLC